jgi:hypothetical protein
MDLGGLGGTALSMFMNWGIWIIVGIFIVMITFGSLYMRKKGKFIFPAIIFTEIGNGKVSITFSRAGWFRSQKILGGLFDYSGERRLEVKDGRMVQQGSSKDFHEIKFKAGLLLQQKSDDPRILVPISSAQLNSDSQRLLLQIAPADYRDACSKIISDTEQETKATWQQVAQILVFGLLAVVLFISIIMTIQYSRNTLADANAIHKEALAFYERTLNMLSSLPSTTAP